MNSKSEFENIALCHLDAVYRFAVTLCHNNSQAEDFVQETFLAAFAKFDGFTRGTNCRAWLFKILKNKWIDHIRLNNAEGTQLEFEPEIADERMATEQTSWSNCEDLLENFSDQQVIKALKSLPDQQRLALFLVDVERISHDEAAQIMDVPIGTVKSRAGRARAALKQVLLDYAGEMGYGKDKK